MYVAQVGEAKARMDAEGGAAPEDRLIVERHLKAEAETRLETLKRQRLQQVK